jgi:hypothetical protein
VDGIGVGYSVYDRDMDGAGALALVSPCVVRIGDDYHMWYSRALDEGGLVYRIAYAISPDGISWTNVPGPATGGAVLEAGAAGNFDEAMVFFPIVTVTGNEFQMWYSGWDSVYEVRTGYATSSDGINWTRVPGNGTGDACLDEGSTGSVIRSGDYYRYWFSSDDTEISLATSGEPEGIGVGDDLLIPRQIELEQNYPNPFNPTTQIEFTISHPNEVLLSVYNIMGQHFEVLARGYYSAGVHQVQFEGSKLTSGVYVYRLAVGEYVSTRKMLLIR